MTESEQNPAVLDLAADIVSSYLAGNPAATEALPELIRNVHRALADLERGGPEPAERPAPAVPVRKSVFPDHIVCLEDGRKLKMLKRHLKAVYGLTPAQYRERWGLAPDYPMVAPNYAARRSALAKENRLGHKADEPD